MRLPLGIFSAMQSLREMFILCSLGETKQCPTFSISLKLENYLNLKDIFEDFQLKENIKLNG